MMQTLRGVSLLLKKEVRLFLFHYFQSKQIKITLFFLFIIDYQKFLLWPKLLLNIKYRFSYGYSDSTAPIIIQTSQMWRSCHQWWLHEHISQLFWYMDTQKPFRQSSLLEIGLKSQIILLWFEYRYGAIQYEKAVLH